jgi:tetratricopeptide (TPR) repeat protein
MFNLAGLKTLEGCPEEGGMLYQKAALKEVSLKPHAALRRAAIAEAAGDWSGAAELYLEAFDRLDNLGEWHENAARCLRRCGRINEALEHYYRAFNWLRRPGAEFIIPQSSARRVESSNYATNPATTPQWRDRSSESAYTKL